MKKKLTQPLAVKKGERVTIERHADAITEKAKPSTKRVPRFGTLKGIVRMSAKQFHEATRPMTDEEVNAFRKGRY